MKFNAKNAETEYITDSSMSFRRIAEKYDVSYHTIQKCAKQNDWVKKRGEYQSKVAQKAISKNIEKESNNLSKLNTIADDITELLESSVKMFKNKKSIPYKLLSEYTKTLQLIVNIQYKLNGKLTVQEENALRMAQDKLELEKQKFNNDDDTSTETGIVLIPTIVEEAEDYIVEEESEDA